MLRISEVGQGAESVRRMSSTYHYNDWDVGDDFRGPLLNCCSSSAVSDSSQPGDGKSCPDADHPVSCGDDSTNPEGSHAVLHTSFDDCESLMDQQRQPQTADVLQFFLQCDFLSPCSVRFLRELIRAGGRLAREGRNVQGGEDVYAEGDIGSSMYIITRGSALVSVKERFVNELGPGRHFGEALVLGEGVRTETVRARTFLHVSEVTNVALSRLLGGVRRPKNGAEAWGADEPDTSSVLSGVSERRQRNTTQEFHEERLHFAGLAAQLQTSSETPAAVPPVLRNKSCTKRPVGQVHASISSTPSSARRMSSPPSVTDTPRSALDGSQIHCHARRPRTTAEERSGRQAPLHDCQDDANHRAARERFAMRLMTSLQCDMWSGYMVPPRSRRRAKRSCNDSFLESPGTLRTVTPPDLTLLPPVDVMISSQKQKLLQQILLHTGSEEWQARGSPRTLWPCVSQWVTGPMSVPQAPTRSRQVERWSALRQSVGRETLQGGPCCLTRPHQR
mmetsp:Transcript_3201/g.9336  ORF Transcript_3201/g.9336 Transcript_3201/m.9336 type:complete len:505 (-) Transcript_3201:48-1562(-)